MSKYKFQVGQRVILARVNKEMIVRERMDAGASGKNMYKVFGSFDGYAWSTITYESELTAIDDVKGEMMEFKNQWTGKPVDKLTDLLPRNTHEICDKTLYSDSNTSFTNGYMNATEDCAKVYPQSTKRGRVMDFPEKKYNIIYADPPWNEQGGGKD